MHARGTPVRGEIRTTGYRRVSHGLYLPLIAGLAEMDEMVRDLAAWRLVLPKEAVFTHVTAAGLAGWWLPRLPEYVPIFAASSQDSGRPRRPGLICSRLVDHEGRRPWPVHDVPLDAPAEILLRAARDLALLDMVPLVDSALRCGHTDRAELDELCGSGRPGVRRLGDAVRLADERSESFWEVMLRVFHVAIGVPVEPQVELFDDQGRFVARADLLITGTHHVQEYDGGVHRNPQQQRRDLRRDRRLAGTSYVRRGYTADDLVNHPLVVLKEIDESLGRPFRPSRVKLWRRWVKESTLSEAGRQRLVNRWLRISGITDWSRTA